MGKKSRKIVTLPPQTQQVSSEPEDVFIMSDAQRGVYTVTMNDIRNYELNPKEPVDNHFGKKRRKCKSKKRSKKILRSNYYSNSMLSKTQSIIASLRLK